MSNIKQFNIPLPFEGHVHFRQGEVLKLVAPHTAKHFWGALVQPNTSPPIDTVEMAVNYRRTIEDATKSVNKNFVPLVGLYLTDDLTPEEVELAYTKTTITRPNLPKRGAEFVKFYPRGGTTNSGHGVKNILACGKVLLRMEKIGMPLCLHGETLDDSNGPIDHLDRERRFVGEVLPQLQYSFPGLKIVLEHISTKEAAWAIKQGKGMLGATVTPQHLMLTHLDLFEGGLRPHLFCMPILKHKKDLEAVRQLVFNGHPQVFAGSDSAPHITDKKHSACCPAGVFSAPGLLERYATIWSNAGKLDTAEHVLRFANFMSVNGPKFYGFLKHPDMLTLVQEKWSFGRDANDGVIWNNGKKEFITFGHPDIGEIPFAWKVEPSTVTA